jgi:hypothetical protein
MSVIPEICCLIKELPEDQVAPAAELAQKINPMDSTGLDRLALATPKRWNIHGQHLTVGFLDDPEPLLIERILSHMNSWGSFCNFQFSQSTTPAAGQVRISRAPMSGYRSYVGTDILHIDSPEPTMWLEDFTMDTMDSEFYRVIRHETGHTMGFVHEHLRKEIVERVDPEPAFAWFLKQDGWDRKKTQQNVLTPLDPSLVSTSSLDPTSIMCYQLPSDIMKEGIGVPGGPNIDATDQASQRDATLFPVGIVSMTTPIRLK